MRRMTRCAVLLAVTAGSTSASASLTIQSVDRFLSIDGEGFSGGTLYVLPPTHLEATGPSAGTWDHTLTLNASGVSIVSVTQQSNVSSTVLSGHIGVNLQRPEQVPSNTLLTFSTLVRYRCDFSVDAPTDIEYAASGATNILDTQFSKLYSLGQVRLIRLADGQALSTVYDWSQTFPYLRSDSASFALTLLPGSYRLECATPGLLYPDFQYVTGSSSIGDRGGSTWDFSLRVVPTPSGSALFISAALVVIRRRRPRASAE